MLLAQLPRPARFRPHEQAALNNANQSRSAETALSFIISGSAPRKTLSNWGTERQKTQMTNRQRDRETDRLQLQDTQVKRNTNRRWITNPGDNAYRRYFGSMSALVVGRFMSRNECECRNTSKLSCHLPAVWGICWPSQFSRINERCIRTCTHTDSNEYCARSLFALTFIRTVANLCVNICSFHSNAPAVATNNKLSSQWTHGAGRWSCNRLKLWPDAARGWPLVVAPSATADNTDTRARAIAMQLWSVWHGGANQAGGEECRARPWLWNCSSFLSGCSWSQIEIENKTENRLKRLALFAFFGASMATRFVAPIKRSLTAVGYLIVGGLSRYAYQVDSFWVLKFF